MPKGKQVLLVAAGLAALVISALEPESSAHAAVKAPTVPGAPIQHVVVLYQENHSFDNVLGKLCVIDRRCDGATSAKLSDGSVVPLAQATDIVPNVAHSTGAQQTAIDGGKMDGWLRISGCSKSVGTRCLTQFAPEQIPNTSALARQYAISDRTFEPERILTFGAHVELAAADLDGFDGTIPSRPAYAKSSGPGWGCSSMKVTGWHATPSEPIVDVPPCVPFSDGTGSWWDSYGPTGAPQRSPVAHVDNIFDRVDGAGLNWKLYNSTPAFDVCQYFATCAHSSQAANVGPAAEVLEDAKDGTLPNLSLVMPNKNKTVGDMSQHNKFSMAAGDNWIGDVVSAIRNGPNWATTAIFITYDDCGCFYDHVPPPNSRLGIRLPMLIVSPFAKPGFTDSTPVSFVGMLAFTEHMFHLAPLSAEDTNSYDYMNAFDFASPPTLASSALVRTPIPESVARQARAVKPDLDDPKDRYIDEK